MYYHIDTKRSVTKVAMPMQASTAEVQQAQLKLQQAQAAAEAGELSALSATIVKALMLLTALVTALQSSNANLT